MKEVSYIKQIQLCKLRIIELEAKPWIDAMDVVELKALKAYLKSLLGATA